MTERTTPWTTKELASAAGVSDAYVRRLCNEKRLKSYKLTGGRDWLIPPDAGQNWLDRRKARGHS